MGRIAATRGDLPPSPDTLISVPAHLAMLRLAQNKLNEMNVI